MEEVRAVDFEVVNNKVAKVVKAENRVEAAVITKRKGRALTAVVWDTKARSVQVRNNKNGVGTVRITRTLNQTVGRKIKICLVMKIFRRVNKVIY